MILTGGKESRTLLVNLVGSRSLGILKTTQKWNEQHLIESPANFRRCSQDNRASRISALIEQIIARSIKKSNDFAAKIAVMSLAVVLPSHMERITIV